MTTRPVEAVVNAVMHDAAEAALKALPLKGDNRKAAIAMLMKRAQTTPAIISKFHYSVDQTSYLGKSGELARPVDGPGVERYETLPSLPMPAVVRTRQKRTRINIDLMMSIEDTDFLNTYYAADFELSFDARRHHDHAVSAASRKIEHEVILSRMISKGADLQHQPSNGYDMSIIDTGGDWRYHHVRNHTAVHTDAPLLDARDMSRDARKRMQLMSDPTNELYVCRNRLQDCKITAPFGMAIQSLYDIPPMTVCESMAYRGIMEFEGTLMLPEVLADFDQLYVDPNYGYVIESADNNMLSQDLYLPPQVRKGVYKYVMGDGDRRVRYRFPGGESREYEHSLANLQAYLEPVTYIVATAHGEPYHYEYKIFKRVGSLAYVSFTRVPIVLPPHIRQMASVVKKPYDGYAITYDSSLIKDYAIKFGTQVTMLVPRSLFTAVATYCLTKVLDPTFSVENAVSYARSAGIDVEANGIMVHKGVSEDSYALTVITGAAAFVWAFDRYRLAEARLPGMAVADVQQQVQDTLQESFIGSSFNITKVYEKMKTLAKDRIGQYVADVAVRKALTYKDLKHIYDQITQSSMFGIKSIVDLHVVYPHLVELMRDSHIARGRISEFAVEAIAATYPHYELPPTAAIRRSRSTDDFREHGAVSDSGVGMSNTSAAQSVVANKPSHVPIIEDMINLATASEYERDQTAKAIFDQVYDLNTRTVVHMTKLRGLVKGTPTVLSYEGGLLMRIWTPTTIYIRGTDTFQDVLQQLAGTRAMYPEKEGAVIQFGTGVVRADGVFVSDRKCRTANQSYDAVIEPALKVLNAERLEKLRERLYTEDQEISTEATVLHDEVAGSGKTHTQCKKYQEVVEAGGRAAIFASTKAAAGQALSRLTAWNVAISPGSISTVDSFLMSPDRWRTYELVLIDEALQLHAGKIYAILMLTGAEIRGFGDSRQIGFINFSRMYKPSVNTSFPWKTRLDNTVTYRVPRGPVVNWLQHPSLYGDSFSTRSVESDNNLALFATAPAFENLITRRKLFEAMGLRSHHKLLVLVYLQDEMLRMRAKLSASDKFVEESFSVAVKTIGESQGDDTDYCILLRLTSREEPLHLKSDQTIVGISRFKKRFGYIRVPTRFPSLLDTIASKHMRSIPSFDSVGSSCLLPVLD